jgi:hypothetical protein
LKLVDRKKESAHLLENNYYKERRRIAKYNERQNPANEEIMNHDFSGDSLMPVTEPNESLEVIVLESENEERNADHGEDNSEYVDIEHINVEDSSSDYQIDHEVRIAEGI